MLKNLVALITGGASGLGKATAERLANSGSKVIICDLPSSNGQDVVAQIGRNVRFMAADVRSRNSVQNIVKQIEQEYGKLNSVVNCAGIHIAYPTYNFNKQAGAQMKDFDSVIQTNLFGTYNVIRQTAKLISKNEPDKNGHRGVIINTAGTEGIKAGRAQTPNGAASRGIMSMTRPLAEEFRKNGIRVVTITAGLFKTPIINFMPVAIQSVLAEKFMLAPHYIGDPDQYAHMVQSIVMSPHINGTSIDMSCGFKLCTNI